MPLLRTTVAAVTLCLAATAFADVQADYQAAVGAYRDQIRQIEKLNSEYQDADVSRREAINDQLKPLVAEASTKLDVMTDAALEVFKANPMADEQITDLLQTVVEFQIVGGPNGGGDQYEAALPILEALIDGGDKKPELPMWGVLAAVSTNEFDLADKFAKIAVETGAVRAQPGDSEAAQETFGAAMRYLEEKDRYRARWEKEAKIRQAEAAADNNPRVKMTLSKGDIVIELFEDQAPIATANFLSLVKDGFYDGVVFHRVLPRFMAQGGDPTGSGSGGPGYSIACECSRPDHRQHFRGTLSMAHAGKDTGGSQFFLCFVPTDFLDGRHTAFGRVVEGIELLGEIQRIDPGARSGVEPDKIVKAEVLRDRGGDYDFKKLPKR
ncbi:putative peptidyl-prolyl cis-trans isomerase [Botrimarina colliarenosi]|uniref:peptidylprolyl isomerase n=1 Tax=Botrimarina colliarenosi TaxID=2528001 RepID=A0A5C6AKH6_9BACT|nr:peptidylprolyl isomerase [Botrimarina colliarenosi]TWU00150.1 putative peptidyl-prolyl cis-trans isomerase [Botrimarina colliarenosi]